MIKREDFFKMFFIDGDNIEIIKLLAEYFEEWCSWNKSHETIEVKKSDKFNVIIVIHELYEDYIKVTDSWDFITDIKFFLKSYSEQSKEDCEYMIEFWEDKVKYLSSL